MVEQEVSLGQEDLGKLGKFLLVPRKFSGMWRTSWRECNSPGYTPCRPQAASCSFLQTSSSFLHSHQFLLGQLLWLLCSLVLSLVVGAPRWQVFIFMVLCIVIQFWSVLLLLLLLWGYEFKIDRNVSQGRI